LSLSSELGREITFIEISDLNNDGNDEIVIANIFGEIFVVNNMGVIINKFSADLGTLGYQTGPSFSEGKALDVSDVNNDGIKDYSAIYSEGYGFIYQTVSCQAKLFH